MGSAGMQPGIMDLQSGPMIGGAADRNRLNLPMQKRIVPQQPTTSLMTGCNDGQMNQMNGQLMQRYVAPAQGLANSMGLGMIGSVRHGPQGGMSMMVYVKYGFDGQYVILNGQAMGMSTGMSMRGMSGGMMGMSGGMMGMSGGMGMQGMWTSGGGAVASNDMVAEVASI